MASSTGYTPIQMGAGEIKRIAAKSAALWKSGAYVEALVRLMRERGLS